MLVRSESPKREKRLAHNVTDTCGTHAGLVHDVKDTDSLAQNGGTRSPVFATFKQCSLTRVDHEST